MLHAGFSAKVANGSWNPTHHFRKGICNESPGSEISEDPEPPQDPREIIWPAGQSSSSSSSSRLAVGTYPEGISRRAKGPGSRVLGLSVPRLSTKPRLGSVIMGLIHFTFHPTYYPEDSGRNPKVRLWASQDVDRHTSQTCSRCLPCLWGLCIGRRATQTGPQTTQIRMRNMNSFLACTESRDIKYEKLRLPKSVRKPL